MRSHIHNSVINFKERISLKYSENLLKERQNFRNFASLDSKGLFSLKNKVIWVVGHNGMVGQAITRKLSNYNTITVSRKKLDLLSQYSVDKWLSNNKPDVVFLTAGKVGGIYANSNYPADFIHQNIMIAANVINSSYKHKIKKLVYLGSSCIYPKNCNQPIDEDQLLSGKPEPTNEWYAIAKIAGIKLCQAYRKQFGCDFISVMPTNLYGPGDNFHPNESHVPAALLDRFHKAKKRNLKNVKIWGSGKPLREFMHVDDLADACIFLARNYSSSDIINIGTGNEISIKRFANLIKEIVGYKGELVFDKNRPDGIYRKLLCTKKMNSMGWKSKISLKDGLEKYYVWYKKMYKNLRR